MVLSMLHIRLEGDEAEERYFLAQLSRAGAEFQIGAIKDRGDVTHIYGTVRMPNYKPPTSQSDGPIRTRAIGPKALPARRAARTSARDRRG